MEFELIEINSCPVCRSNAYRVAFRKGEFIGKKCIYCGLIYLSPRINNLEKVYTDDETSSTSLYYKYAVEADRKTFTKRMKLIEQYAEKDSFLDVGSSTGTFLEVAKQSGWKNVLGVEPNPNSAVLSKERGLPVINDFFGADLFKKGQKFDAVYIGDVIEHVPNPEEVLKNIYAVLKDGGIVMVVTPNFESLAARILQIKPREHILYFTKKSLSYLLSRTGFKAEKLSAITRDRSIKAMVYSTTFDSKKGKMFLNFIVSLRLETFVNLFLKLFVRDEIMAIGRKG